MRGFNTLNPFLTTRPKGKWRLVRNIACSTPARIVDTCEINVSIEWLRYIRLLVMTVRLWNRAMCVKRQIDVNEYVVAKFLTSLPDIIKSSRRRFASHARLVVVEIGINKIVSETLIVVRGNVYREKLSRKSLCKRCLVSQLVQKDKAGLNFDWRVKKINFLCRWTNDETIHAYDIELFVLECTSQSLDAKEQRPGKH